MIFSKLASFGEALTKIQKIDNKIAEIFIREKFSEG